VKPESAAGCCLISKWFSEIVQEARTLNSSEGAGMSSVSVGEPVERQSEKVPRRRFVNLLLGTGLVGSAASFLYPIMKYFVPPKVADMGGDAVLAAKISELKPNTAKTFRFGTRPGLLVEVAPGEYRAMSATCTHLGCTVQYRPDLREIWCACHKMP